MLWKNTIIVLLSLIFIISGISKIIYINYFLSILIKYKLFPDFILPYLALILICLEITIGICLLLPKLRQNALISLIGLLIMFILLVLYVQIRNIDVPCGCFAIFKERKMGIGLALQDLFLLFLAIKLFLYERKTMKLQQNKLD